MRFERGKLYQVTKISPTASPTDYHAELILLRVASSSLPLPEPGVNKEVDFIVDSHLDHRLVEGDIFMFLQYEYGFTNQHNDPQPKYIIVLFDQAI